MRSGALAAVLLGAWAVAGCGSHAPAAPTGVFVAFASDFADFHGWSAAPATPASTLPPVDGGDGIDAGAVPDGGVHPQPLTVYWNAAPPHGSTSFPVGTIVVKETAEGDLTARRIFAMVKRGGDFNPLGAIDWEWFELQNTVDGGVLINWRGISPPSGSGDVYAGNPNVCNDCHLRAIANDDVWSSALQLSNF